MCTNQKKISSVAVKNAIPTKKRVRVETKDKLLENKSNTQVRREIAHQWMICLKTKSEEWELTRESQQENDCC